jgi:hypothetical protein
VGIRRLAYSALAILLGATALSGCALIHWSAGDFGDSVDGTAVQRTIDANIASIIRSYDSTLKIEPAQCPAHLDLSHGKTVTCSLAVNGIDLPVVVKYQGPSPQGYNVNLPGSFFERRVVERGVAVDPAIGQIGNVKCVMPEVAILAKGTIIMCQARGAKRDVPIKVTVGEQGRVVFGSTVKLAEPPPERAIDAAVKEHESGKPTHMSGSMLAQYIDTSLKAELSQQQVAIGHTVCPTSVDLSGSHRGLCKLSLQGQHPRVAVWIDHINKGSFHWLPIDATFDLEKLSNILTDQLNGSLQQNGFTSVAKVSCGSGTIVVPAPGTIMCGLQLDGRPDISNGVLQQVRVDVLDGMGRIKTRVVASEAHS